MDFNRQIIHPLPFYMTYPGYFGSAQADAALQDLEYLQQTYPREVKRYQCKIAEILDKLDYEGSMIYDEYPDCYSLQRLADTIVRILQQEEAASCEEALGSSGEGLANGAGIATKEGIAGSEKLTAEEWKLMKDMVQVLLCNEVYKRRHGGRRFAKF